MRDRDEGCFSLLLSFTNHHIRVFCDQEGFQSNDMQLPVSRGDWGLSYQRHRFPIRLNGLPTILCHISPSPQRSKGLLNCDQIILTNMMQCLPPKESICLQSCNTVSQWLCAGINFPMIPYDIPQADFHLIVTVCTIAHSLIWYNLGVGTELH